jgi:2-oxoglutarate ferredoxin oxidoreductase subunit delta
MLKNRKKIVIQIDESFCKGCNICFELCAENVFVISEQINSLGYYVPVPVNLKNCTGCMICELICPELAVILEKTGIEEEPAII